MKLIKQLSLFILSIGLSTSILAQGQGIEFFHGSFEEALELAKKEHKIIFMDAYAVWCGPCKRMAKEVFTDKEVGDFFNKHFINVKMDMEKGEGPKLAQKYKVSAYPTLLFIDAEGEVVNLQKGALPSKRFVALGKSSLNASDKSGDFEADYENGNREPGFLKAYAYALLTSGKPTLKIANDYLRTQEDLSTEENLEFIFDFASEADCNVFDALIEHRKAILELKGKEVFKKQVKRACEVTVEKAVEYRTPDLVDEAKDQMKAAMPSFAKEFNALADIRYAYSSNDLQGAIKHTEKYVRKFAKGDADKLYQHAQLFNQFVTDEKALKSAMEWAKEAYEITPSYKHGRTYLDLLRKNDLNEEARDLEQEIMKLKS